MPHISHKKLDDTLYQQLFSHLVELHAGSSKRHAASFLTSLLTPTEQVMLTKRCAAAVMFAQGYSNYRVWTTLHISQSTAARLREQYDEGVFEGVITLLVSKQEKQKESDEFVATLEKILRLGMPSMGKDRWKSLPR